MIMMTVHMRPPHKTGEQPSSDAVEAEARRLLRDQIERSAWFPAMRKEERRAKIEQEVDAWWHLKVKEAATRLLDRMVGDTERGSRR